MASSYTPKWKRVLQGSIPWLFSKCLGGNMHWRWDLTCFCVINENSQGMWYRRNNNDYWRECPRCVEGHKAERVFQLAERRTREGQ